MTIRIMRMFLILILVVFGCVAQAHAESFSEINADLFQSLSRTGTQVGWKDPFSAGASSAQDLVIEDLQLMGVVIGQVKSFALVSGFVVEKGDIIGGFKVHSIDRRQVVLKRLDEVYVLSMGGGL